MLRMSHLLSSRGTRSWRRLGILAVLALSACDSNSSPAAHPLVTSGNVSLPVLAWPFPGLWPPAKSSGTAAPAPFPIPPGFPWQPPGTTPPPPPETCTPACTNGLICTSGACACPHPGDLQCAKGCTNPKTDNFACGCVTGGFGSICTVAAECCGGKCTTCPKGQSVDPVTCGCKVGGGGGSTTTTSTEQPTLWLLTNSSNGTYFGIESDLKKRTRCSFEGGGINCKPTDLVTYKKLMEPAATPEKSHEAACASFTKRYNHPLGIGWKALWKPTNERYGLWDSTVGFLHKCVPDGL